MKRVSVSAAVLSISLTSFSCIGAAQAQTTGIATPDLNIRGPIVAGATLPQTVVLNNVPTIATDMSM
jgi:hypothetical protein